jgi:hypothetical protein
MVRNADLLAWSALPGITLVCVSPFGSEVSEDAPEMSSADLLCDERQTTRHLLMIRPSHFGPNPQTAESNQFQQPAMHSAADVSVQAMREFDGVIAALDRAGVQTSVVADVPGGRTPDAVFPNNWMSTHFDGTVVLYPMAAANRRAERRLDILDRLAAEGGFHVRRVIDLSGLEQSGSYLEGTGSLVFDRPRRTAFAARSARTHEMALAEFSRLTGYRIVAFNASIGAGQAVYHTNVLMSLGRHIAVLCSDAIGDRAERRAVCAELMTSRHCLLSVSADQVLQFAANCLEVDSPDGAVLVLSETALRSLCLAQRRVLERYTALLPVDVATIEHVGGGSVRCMLAEIHLPRSAQLDSLPV